MKSDQNSGWKFFDCGNKTTMVEKVGQPPDGNDSQTGCVLRNPPCTPPKSSLSPTFFAKETHPNWTSYCKVDKE